MAESKVQKVARHAAIRQAAGTCPCGGDQVWAKVIGMHGRRMHKVCEKCGSLDETQSN